MHLLLISQTELFIDALPTIIELLSWGEGIGISDVFNCLEPLVMLRLLADDSLRLVDGFRLFELIVCVVCRNIHHIDAVIGGVTLLWIRDSMRLVVYDRRWCRLSLSILSHDYIIHHVLELKALRALTLSRELIKIKLEVVELVLMRVRGRVVSGWHHNIVHDVVAVIGGVMAMAAPIGLPTAIVAAAVRALQPDDVHILFIAGTIEVSGRRLVVYTASPHGPPA